MPPSDQGLPATASRSMSGVNWFPHLSPDGQQVLFIGFPLPLLAADMG